MRFFKYLFYFLFFLNSSIISAQTIKGKIVDVNKNPIPRAGVLIKNPENSELISEFVNANNGEYLIKLKKDYPILKFEITANGFDSEFFEIVNPVKNGTYVYDVILFQEKINNLEEVIITSEKKAFVVEGDTVKFNVSSYRDGTESKIEDLIKKVPGIEVNSNTGEIKYKGKSIETVKLEGDDLFGKNYALGTKNINVDIVDQVEAIENYSENELLKGIENSDKVALNLKIKKGKLDFSGDFKFGQGYSENNKPVYDTNANVLSISNTFKSFGVFSYNNVGVNNTPFDYFGSSASLEQVQDDAFMAGKAIPENTFSSVLDNQRANVNNAILGNYNSIFKVNKNASLKTNVYYIGDRIRSQSYYENNYVSDNQYLVTTDDFRATKKPSLYKGDLELKIKTSKDSEIVYELGAYKENIKTSSAVLLNSQDYFTNKLNSESFFIKNKFLFTQRISSEKVFQIMANQSYNHIPQDMFVAPSSILYEGDGNLQNSNSKKKHFDIKSIFLGRKNNSKYAISLGYVHSETPYNSKLINIDNGDVPATIAVNELDYKKSQFFLSAYNSFKYRRWKITPSFSVSMFRQSLNDYALLSNNHRNDLVFSPNFDVLYKLNSVSSVSANINYNESPIVENHLFKNQILVDYKTLISNDPSLKLQKIFSYGANYRLNDLYNQFQMNFGVNYSQNENNFISDNLIEQNYIQVEYLFIPEKNYYWNFNFFSEKYIPSIQTNASISSSYMISKYKNIVNESELRDNQLNFWSSKIALKTAFDLVVNFENSFGVKNSKSNSQQSQVFKNTSINNSFKAIIKPVKKWISFFTVDYFMPNIDKSNEDYLFLDATVRYKLKKNMEINFIAKNLLNNDSFIQVETTDFSQTFSQSNLISRYFLVTFSYGL